MNIKYADVLDLQTVIEELSIEPNSQRKKETRPEDT